MEAKAQKPRIFVISYWPRRTDGHQLLLRRLKAPLSCSRAQMKLKHGLNAAGHHLAHKTGAAAISKKEAGNFFPAYSISEILEKQRDAGCRSVPLFLISWPDGAEKPEYPAHLPQDPSSCRPARRSDAAAPAAWRIFPESRRRRFLPDSGPAP